MRIRVRLARVALLAGLAALGGCGRQAHPVSGVVTRDGSPVPVGLVRFTPDVDKGNKGPSVVLDVRDGKFNSAAAREPVAAGEHVVTVMVVPPESKGEMPAEEFPFHVTVPPGGKSDFAFDISKRPREGRKR